MATNQWTFENWMSKHPEQWFPYDMLITVFRYVIAKDNTYYFSAEPKNYYFVGEAKNYYITTKEN